MSYSETRKVMGGLAHVLVLILLANFSKGKFEVKFEEVKKLKLEKPVKVIEVKNFC